MPSAGLAAEPKYVTFYLVGSEAERERVIAGENEAASERDRSGIREPNASFAVFVARTPNERGSALLSIFDSTSSLTNTVVNIVELPRR
jgi:hypothetical protein